jgi:DegQ (SacQ) family.
MIDLLFKLERPIDSKNRSLRKINKVIEAERI